MKNQLPDRQILSHSSQNTIEIGENLAKHHLNGGIFCLFGDLGAGKTVFTKGFAKGLGIEEKKVKSPTYTFMRSYRVGDSWLHHFDFYRIEAIDDLLTHDLEEIFQQKKSWIVIEWPERIFSILPSNRINISFEYLDSNKRSITIDDESKKNKGAI